MLRAKLRLTERTQDHSLLDRLVAIIIKIAQAVAIAVVATAAGTLATGGILFPAEVVNAGAIALVTIALQNAATAIRTRRSEHNPATATRKVLVGLNSELANFISTPRTTSAYAYELPVGRIRLLVKAYKVQQALIENRWENKVMCWNVLDDLVWQLSRRSDTNAGELEQILRWLRAVQDQAPKG